MIFNPRDIGVERQRVLRIRQERGLPICFGRLELSGDRGSRQNGYAARRSDIRSAADDDVDGLFIRIDLRAEVCHTEFISSKVDKVDLIGRRGAQIRDVILLDLVALCRADIAVVHGDIEGPRLFALLKAGVQLRGSVRRHVQQVVKGNPHAGRKRDCAAFGQRPSGKAISALRRAGDDGRRLRDRHRLPFLPAVIENHLDGLLLRVRDVQLDRRPVKDECVVAVDRPEEGFPEEHVLRLAVVRTGGNFHLLIVCALRFRQSDSGGIFRQALRIRVCGEIYAAVRGLCHGITGALRKAEYVYRDNAVVYAAVFIQTDDPADIGSAAHVADDFWRGFIDTFRHAVGDRPRVRARDAAYVFISVHADARERAERDGRARQIVADDAAQIAVGRPGDDRARVFIALRQQLSAALRRALRHNARIDPHDTSAVRVIGKGLSAALDGVIRAQTALADAQLDQPLVIADDTSAADPRLDDARRGRGGDDLAVVNDARLFVGPDHAAGNAARAIAVFQRLVERVGKAVGADGARSALHVGSHVHAFHSAGVEIRHRADAVKRRARDLARNIEVFDDALFSDLINRRGIGVFKGDRPAGAVQNAVEFKSALRRAAGLQRNVGSH